MPTNISATIWPEGWAVSKAEPLNVGKVPTDRESGRSGLWDRYPKPEILTLWIDAGANVLQFHPTTIQLR